MKRIDGFLDLDSYFKKIKKEQKLSDTDLFFEEYISKSEYRDDQFWLKISGEIYYFKPTNSPYEELIVSECAKFLGIPAVEYVLARFNGKEGVISKSFRKDQNNYISGLKILHDYFLDHTNHEYLEAMGFEYIDEILGGYSRISWNPMNIAEAMQTLEIIWHALEYRYKDDLSDIPKIMDGLVNYLMLGILCVQNDGFPQNWEIEESIDGIKLVPYFDGGDSFNGIDNKPNMSLPVSFDDKDAGNYKILEKFLSISSKEYIEKFMHYFDKLDLVSFMKIMKNVETKIGVPLPSYTRSRIIGSFSDNQEIIENILYRYKVRR